MSLLDLSDTVLAQTDFDSDILRAPGANSNNLFFDYAPVALTCGTAYRLVLSSTDSGTARLAYHTVPSVAMLDGIAWQQSVYLTQGSPGSWTDTTTTYPRLMPFISDITEPTGGGFTGTHQYIGLGR
jgi:hypothetical protein